MENITIDTGTDPLLCEIKDRVAIITLNRPEVRNALGDEITPALRRMIRERAQDTNVGALLLTALLLWFPAFAQTRPTIVPPSPRSGSIIPLPPRAVPDRPGLRVVAEIIVEGTQRIEPETVRSYMLIKEGDPLDPDRVNQSLKGLYSVSYTHLRAHETDYYLL